MAAESAKKSHITTHILDTGSGRPARGVKATLEARSGSGWQEIGSGETDADGRITQLGPARVQTGRYRVSFEIGEYFEEQQTQSFFPAVTIDFYVNNVDEHYHVPLLISPFAYSTYRGS